MAETDPVVSVPQPVVLPQVEPRPAVVVPEVDEDAAPTLAAEVERGLPRDGGAHDGGDGVDAQHGDAHGAAGVDHGAHPFVFTDALAHHNLPYPAWEPIHGKPLLIFDALTYSLDNIDALVVDPAFAKTQPDARQLAWAEDYCKSNPDIVNYDAFDGISNLEAGPRLATAMAVADARTTFGSFPRALHWVNQQIFFGSIALLLLTLVVCLLFRRRSTQVLPSNRVQQGLEAITIYFRDNIVEPSFHGHGSAWTPFFVSIFLMILSINLMGLIPGTGTMSGNIGVTGAFATMILLMMLGCGMAAQGPKYWITLVPIHFSWAMSPVWLLLLVIELLGLALRPFALAVRLFANMFAGHTVLLVFLSLGYVILAQSGEGSRGLALGLHATGFLLAIGFHAMELLVAFIQAYVFTMLSAMFIGASIHPEH
ncbi:MAG: F0F1 ATP synthase subunit A [Planctomycetes bacterium]|nr:F0F1 ATP synthase subunit A [Planctomycetota bacterium]